MGLLFCQLAWKLVSATPKAFTDHRHSIWWLGGATVVVITAALLLRRRKITLFFVVLAMVAMVLTFHGSVTFGPSAVHLPHLSWTAFTAAAVALVLPQVPLSFANSCLATADVAGTYFGDAARRVRPGRLAPDPWSGQPVRRRDQWHAGVSRRRGDDSPSQASVPAAVAHQSCWEAS